MRAVVDDEVAASTCVRFLYAASNLRLAFIDLCAIFLMVHGIDNLVEVQ